MATRDRLTETASQTAGPYVHIGCIPSFAGVEGVYDADLGVSPMQPGALGAQIIIEGSLFDGAGEKMYDAMVESWQADAAGLYPGQAGADPKVSGFCRFAVEPESGEFRLHTIKPGPVLRPDGAPMAPHISLWIVARGINIGLSTRMYFGDEDNGADPLLVRITPSERAHRLVAKKTGDGMYRFDIHLQGENETVFLDI